MHKFPENEEQRKLWAKFGRRHRPDFTATSSSVIYSAHFEKSCFATRYQVGVPDELKPRSRCLIPGSVPAKDTIIQEEKPVTDLAREETGESGFIYSFMFINTIFVYNTVVLTISFRRIEL